MRWARVGWAKPPEQGWGMRPNLSRRAHRRRRGGHGARGRAQLFRLYHAPLPTLRHHTLEQHVALLAQRQLDHAFRPEVPRRQHHLLVGDGDVVDFEPAGLDLAARLTVRRNETRIYSCSKQAESRRLKEDAVKVNSHRYGWQRFGQYSFLEGLARGSGSFVAGSLPGPEG